MLFWAVDNPAPANYLLISGDRDFSNALHQLRMRRYNILLAQPAKASSALVAAAKVVWLWASLVTGGSPLSYGDSTRIANLNMFSSKFLQNPISDPIEIKQPGDGSLFWGNQIYSSVKTGDSKSRGKYARKSLNQPMVTRALSAPLGIQGIKKDECSLQAEKAPSRQFKKAPHEFFRSSESVVSSSRSAANFLPGDLNGTINNCNNFAENQRNQCPQAGIALAPDNMFMTNVSSKGSQSFPVRPNMSMLTPSPVTNLSNVPKLNVSECSDHSQNSLNFHQEVVSPNLSSQSGMQKGQYHNIPKNKDSQGFLFSPVAASTVSGTQGCSHHPEFVQGLVVVVLLALNTLKVEKIMPTEANIKDCIHFGELHRCNTDVKKALDYAIEQHMVVKQNLGAVELYVGKNEKLWKCVNPMGGNLNQHPRTTWDGIQKFLTTSAGRLAIMDSQCRYEAALILKSACLKELPLGDVLQILNMIITIKRWILHHHS